MDVASVDIDLAAVSKAQKVVLAEGGSDKAAVEVVARRRGQVLGGAGICVVAMGGATNIGHFLALPGLRGINARLAGLCDAGQEGFIREALERGGPGSSTSRTGLEALGFYVCTADLEDGRFGDYWHRYAFGDLGAGAEVRREVMASLVPMLTIAGRCELEGRFLVVRGDLRTYRIHLGSGNILMSPNDQYLCIVTARDTRTSKLFLPFDDDPVLSLILSKAFLLANDTKITDESITRQIGTH